MRTGFGLAFEVGLGTGLDRVEKDIAGTGPVVTGNVLDCHTHRCIRVEAVVQTEQGKELILRYQGSVHERS